MTNINITIPDELHKELKVKAALSERSLKEVVIDSLKGYVEDGR